MIRCGVPSDRAAKLWLRRCNQSCEDIFLGTGRVDLALEPCGHSNPFRRKSIRFRFVFFLF